MVVIALPKEEKAFSCDIPWRLQKPKKQVDLFFRATSSAYRLLTLQKLLKSNRRNISILINHSLNPLLNLLSIDLTSHAILMYLYFLLYYPPDLLQQIIRNRSHFLTLQHHLGQQSIFLSYNNSRKLGKGEAKYARIYFKLLQWLFHFTNFSSAGLLYPMFKNSESCLMLMEEWLLEMERYASFRLKVI